MGGIFEALKRIMRGIKRGSSRTSFTSSVDYWMGRYANGGYSGAGSYNHLAMFKAEVINAFVTEQGIASVIEFGCGDGNQLQYANYPLYMGFDVSQVAIEQCTRIHVLDASKRFALLRDYSGETAELALSLDVIFHLVEDQVFDEYMRRLFAAATRFVIIYSSDKDDNASNDAPHVRHRCFSRWVAENSQDWRLMRTIKNRYPYDGDYTKTSFCDFFIYERVTN